MNTWFPLLILFFTWSLIFNVIIKDKFDKLTGYKDWQFHSLPNWFIWTFMLFGMFMFPFYKLVKEYRKTFYIKKEIEIYERYERMFRDGHINKDRHIRDAEQYNMNKRYIKLKKLRKKIYVSRFR